MQESSTLVQVESRPLGTAGDELDPADCAGLDINDAWFQPKRYHWMDSQVRDAAAPASERRDTVIREDLEPLFLLGDGRHARTDERVAWLYSWLSPPLHALGDRWRERRQDSTYARAIDMLRSQWASNYFHPFAGRRATDQLLASLGGFALVRLSSTVPLRFAMSYNEFGTLQSRLVKVSSSTPEGMLRIVSPKGQYVTMGSLAQPEPSVYSLLNAYAMTAWNKDSVSLELARYIPSKDV